MTEEESSAGEPWSENVDSDEIREHLTGLSLADLVEWFSADDEYDHYYEEVAKKLYEHGRAGIEVLFAELDGRRVSQWRAALVVLSLYQGEDPKLVEKAKLRVGDPEPLIAGDAIWFLRLSGNTDLSDTIRGMKGHPDEFVRAKVLEYLAYTELEAVYPALVQGLGDTSYIVRETIIDVFDDLQVTDAIGLIEPLLEDPHEDVRQAARTAVDNLRDLLDSPE
ncbi:HEAT repeat domain-containing protein [Nocardia sp. 004]|uniref:HEAT repeat domain-containing protein n=1 Tax=Nocardia sp. 004 TaxID=3385978 RepID=UPI00399F5582